jgi:hypothetical protein
MLGKKICKFFVVLPFLLIIINQPVLSASAGSLWDRVYQGGLQGVDEKFGASGQPKDVRQIVAEAIKVLLSFLALIFLILIIWAGYKYMMSQGDSGQVEEAVHMMRSAVIGLLIVLAALGITVYVQARLMEATTGTYYF